ncbi:hypothetical protein [Paenibacillus gallinarum]|uniref:Uncharacterized protein n=1 Tax=Paenibacillus gallinarum TaxID=2762232 RepID=A0ABR8T5G1_9BACL|nr:hypothetical protein [Paenibacillus gallinarum]MBD7971003.1 hypothetical protein [Paenibacillus gallinarum]
MLYRLNEKNLNFLNPLDGSEVNIDLSMFQNLDNFHFILSKNNSQIAFSGIVDGVKNMYVMSLHDKKNWRNIYQGQLHDYTWLTDFEIIINTGKEICKLNVDNGALKMLYKFSRINMAPLSMLVNEDGTKIMAVTVHNKPFVYDLINQEVTKIPFRITNYCWINKEEILYSNLNGIKRFNVVTGKKFNFITTIKMLEKIPGFSEIFEGVHFNEMNIDITEPKLFGNQVFFKLSISRNVGETISAVLSVDINLSKIERNYLCQKGLFSFYEPMLDGKVISILGIPEERESTILIHNKATVINYKGYYPSPNISIPTRSFPYQGYYESY